VHDLNLDLMTCLMAIVLGMNVRTRADFEPLHALPGTKMLFVLELNTGSNLRLKQHPLQRTLQTSSHEFLTYEPSVNLEGISTPSPRHAPQSSALVISFANRRHLTQPRLPAKI
jgi:hypothetical protein